MPNSKSASKSLRQSKKRAVRNSRVRKTMRSAVKAVRENGQKADLLVTAQKTLDKAVKNGIIKKNTAARMKSRLMTVRKSA